MNQYTSELMIHEHVWNWYLRTEFCWVRRKYSDHPWKRKFIRELLCRQWLLIMTHSSKNCRHIYAESRQTCLLAFLAEWDSMGKWGPAPWIYIQPDNKLTFNLRFVPHPGSKIISLWLLTSLKLFWFIQDPALCLSIWLVTVKLKDKSLGQEGA